LASPDESRGNGAGNSFDARYPTGMTPKIYTKIDFFEYRRDIGSNAQRRQTGSIRLPTPEQFNDSSGIRTSDASLGILGGFADYISKGGSVQTAGRDFTTAVNDFQSKFGAMESSVSNIANLGLAIASLMPGGSDAAGVARSFAGIIPNPHVTLLFEGVGLKAFDFQWRLSPRSQQDATAINNIIRTIKARIHPETMRAGGTSYALLYPDLVRVQLVGSRGLEQTDFAFVENFNASFSGSGNSMSFYKDGQPVEAMITMRVKEIDIRTREDFVDAQPATAGQ
jgi:hypothetical protein